MQKHQLCAKLNWTLDVLGRREDGFHELQSWFLALDWGDVLHFKTLDPSAVSQLTLSGPHCQGVPQDTRNLLLLAEQNWRAAGGQAAPINWHLEKLVPAGAGLGGGSSDAAGALRILQRVAQVPLKESVCLEVAQQLGSDVGFFYQGGSAELRGGRGELILNENEAPPVWIVLALTGLHASTPEVFAQLKAPPLREPTPKSQSNQDLLELPSQPSCNQLEVAALRCVPGLAEFAKKLRKVGLFTMSGSGSTFFSVVPNQAKAVDLSKAIAGMVPEVVMCQPRVADLSAPSNR